MQGGPVVLVGHSYGGAVITNAADGNPNVKALVYVDAAAPDVGETNGQLSGSRSVLTTGSPATLYQTVPRSSHAPGAHDLYLHKAVFVKDFGDPKYRACPLLRKYVAAGWLGRKSGRGFHIY